MASFLHRLGLAAARRPLAALLAWIIALAVGVGAFLAFGGTLTSVVTIPNTETAQVTDRLKEEFPAAARGSGQVLFTTTDGKPFTDDQKTRIGALLEDVAGQDAVESTVDPFETQQKQDDARTQLAEGKQEVTDGEQRLTDGQAQLEDGRSQLADAKAKAEQGAADLEDAKKQLDEGQAQLDAARADIEARGVEALPQDAQDELDAAQQKIDDGQAQLEAGRAQLEAKKKELADGQAQLEAKKKELADAQAQIDAKKQELEEGREQLEAAREQAIAQGEQSGLSAEDAAAAADRQLAPQQQRLEAGAAELEKAQAQADAGAAELEKAQAQADAGAQQLADAQAKLDASAQQLEDGRAQLEDGRRQALEAAADALDEKQAELDAGRKKYEQGVADLKSGREQIAENEAKLDQAEQDLADGRAELADGRAQTAQGQRTLDLAGDFRAVSEDGTTAVGMVSFVKPSLDVSSEEKAAVADALTSADIPGVEVHPTQEITATVPSIVGPTEVIGLIVAAVVLVVMLGTFVAGGLPLLNALIGVGVGVTASLAFSGAVEMMSLTPVLGIMLGLAVGLDYALFIINRHRQELKRGVPLRESIALANGTSGNAVVFAGLTVIIALLALNVTGIPFLGMMGTVGAVCVTIAVLVAVTLTPALLSLIKLRVLSRKERRRLAEQGPAADGTAAHDEEVTRAVRGAHRPARMSTPAAVVTVLVSVAALVLVALPFGSMRLGLPDGGSEPVGSDAQVAYTLIGDKFGEGYNSPLVVTVDLPAGMDEDAATDLQLDVGEQLAGVEHVRTVVPAGFNEDRTVAMYQLIPEEGPTAVSTEDLVHTLRGLDPAGDASNLGVAGVTSGFIDVSEKLSQALPLYLGVVVGLSLLIMILVFRSILVPLIATGGFVLSVFAAMGGVVAIYQWGWLASLFGVHHPGPVLSFLPTIMIGVLFGLAMDYQLFIASGMREAYAHGQPARDAVLTGVRAGRSVVVAAAIIMVSVFGGFIFSHDAMIRPIGFGLAFGVLLDAFVVRLVLMPALMHLLGESAWWLPRWLERILPDVDVEGASLERHAHLAAAPEGGLHGPTPEGGLHGSTAAPSA